MRNTAKLSEINTMLQTAWETATIFTECGPLYYGTAPETETYPFTTYQIISNTFTYSTCEDLDRYLIQFAIFAPATAVIFEKIDAVKEFFSGYSETLNNTKIEAMLPTNVIILPKIPNTSYIQGVVNFNLWAGYTE